ncbi:hypothetical protein [Paraurantiacibacter namhicola]|nr:hypothetical protein [Paraurantiacibacter namhicola]
MASGPPRIPVERIDRALEGAPGEAQPSKLVATELAFARAAQEDGQWTATRAFAGPGAMIHGPNGAIPALPWLQKQSDPAQAAKWAPREIWMSCDGALAVSSGRFVDPEGLVGTYLTVWQRQGREDYRWVYDSAQPDNPQPPARFRPEAQEGDIVVTALDAVQGNVADCPRGATAPDEKAVAAMTAGRQQATRTSPDGTLAYRWEHRSGANGPERYFTAYWLHEGKWQVAVEEVWAGS